MAQAVNEGAVTLDGLCKRFGDVDAVVNLSLDVPGGQFFSLLGPSGCGKTTTLRMHRGLRGADLGPDPDRRGRHDAHARPQAAGQHGLPELRPLPPPDREGQRRLRPALHPGNEEWRSSGRSPTPSPSCSSRVSSGAGRTSSRAASSSGSRSPARSCWSRRVLLLDEPLGALDAKLRRDAPGRAEGDSRRGRDHLPLRHARPGGGADDVRPPGRHARRGRPADRLAARRLRGARDRLRRRRSWASRTYGRDRARAAGACGSATRRCGPSAARARPRATCS